MHQPRYIYASAADRRTGRRWTRRRRISPWLPAGVVTVLVLAAAELLRGLG
jgi:hypothetical protein